MTITRVGTNQQYADGWDKAFTGKRSSAKSAPKKAAASKKAAPSKKAKPKKSAKKGRK